MENNNKTKILFVETDEVSFQFRKCMAQVIASLPPFELVHAKDATEALELIDRDGADVLVVDDELSDELSLIIDSLGNSNIPILLQSDVESLENYDRKLNITVIPKEESIDHFHRTLLAATEVNLDKVERKVLH